MERLQISSAALELCLFVAQQEDGISPRYQPTRNGAPHAARAAKNDCFHTSSPNVRAGWCAARRYSGSAQPGKLSIAREAHCWGPSAFAVGKLDPSSHIAFVAT